MNCLVVHAHPNPDSFNHALRRTAVETLEASGHAVTVLDLYAINYQPCITEAEHVNYERLVTSGPETDVAEHMRLVSEAGAVIFVYPTWWAGLPAILKGWLERTMLPGFAFELAPVGSAVKVQPKLTNIKHLVGITTYGSGRAELLLLGDAGRRTITRTVRALCGSRTSTTWLGMHRLDGSSDRQRAEFLTRVADELGKQIPAAGSVA